MYPGIQFGQLILLINHIWNPETYKIRHVATFFLISRGKLIKHIPVGSLADIMWNSHAKRAGLPTNTLETHKLRSGRRYGTVIRCHTSPAWPTALQTADCFVKWPRMYLPAIPWVNISSAGPRKFSGLMWPFARTKFAERPTVVRAQSFFAFLSLFLIDFLSNPTVAENRASGVS